MRAITGRGGGGGGKGGAGGGRTPVEAPNTLRSRATARLIDAISEGPIVGLVNGLRSVFFDDTPLQNPNGSFNFSGVTVETRLGTPDQAHLRGYPAIESETPVGAEVRAAIPLTRSVTNTDADAVRVTIRIPGLVDTNQETGDINGSTVTIAIDIAEDGGAFVERVRDRIAGKTTSPYERAYRIALPRSAAGGPWLVRVRRLTPDSTRATLQNATFWSSFTTITDQRLIYPDTALVGLTVNAEEFGSTVPRRAYEVRGMVVRVPTNYNPTTRAYTGLWNGTFKQAWTDNPAWVFFDLATHPRYGLGEFLDSRFGMGEPDKWELYEVARYCDELVPNGFGGLEPRFTFNGVIENREEANRVLVALAGAFRAMLFLSAGGLFVSQDRPRDPVKLVTPANVVGGEFVYSGVALSARHTVALVSWRDPADGYNTAIEIVEDSEGVARFGWREKSVIAFGCTSRGQARRFGLWMLESERSESELVTYAASFDHADVTPGDVIAIQDPSYAGVRYGGRVLAIVQDETDAIVGVQVDAPVEIMAGESYTLSVVMPDGSIAERALTTAPSTTDVLTLASPLDEAPVAGAMWVLTATNLEPRLFRVLVSKEAAKNVFEITAVFHEPGKFDKIEQGISFDPPPRTLFPTGGLLAPSDLSIAEYLYLAGGVTARAAVTVSWTARDIRADFHEVQFRPLGETEWRNGGVAAGASIDIQDFASGSFEFRVRAVSRLVGVSPWSTLTAPVLGLLAPPPDVERFRISVLGDVATLTWQPSPALNLSHYEIRFSSAVSGVTWGAAVPLLTDVTGASVQAPAMVGTYLIKAVTLQGVTSAGPALIISKVAKFANFNVVELIEEDPDFAGVKDGVARNPNFAALQLDYARDVFEGADWFEPGDWFLGSEGLLAEGVYAFAGGIDLGHVYTSRLSAEIGAFGVSLTDDVFALNDWFEAEDFFRDDPALWDVTVEYRATDDDPAGSPEWSDWEPVVIGDVTARAYEFRAVLRSSEFGVTPFVTRLAVEVDMPDRVLAGKDLVVTTSGRRVDFEPPYLSLAGVSISAQELATGDFYEITGKDRSGFDIVFRNAAGTPIARTFDYVSQGYGREED